MRGLLAAGLLLLGGAAGPGSDVPLFEDIRATELAPLAEVPGELGDLSAHEVVTGAFLHSLGSGRYRFLVNPRLQALYQVMQYRMSVVDDPGTPAEKVVWNSHPGAREPLVVFERMTGPGPARWRRLAPGTLEYNNEMWRVMRVLGEHGVLRRDVSP